MALKLPAAQDPVLAAMTPRPRSQMSQPASNLDPLIVGIQVEMETLIITHNKFGWQDLEPGIRKTIRARWVAALEGFGLSEIQAACRKFTAQNPDGNPNEGHIRKLILQRRGRELRNA